MKIWYQYPGPLSPFRKDVVFNSVRGIADRVRRPDTEIDIYPISRGATAYGAYTTKYASNLSNQEIIDTISQAGDAGYDGAIIGVSGDSGLPEVKELLQIPVVGLTEALCHFMLLYGERIGFVINPTRGGSARVRGIQTRLALISRYTSLDRVVGIEEVGMPQDRFLEDLNSRKHDEIVTKFEEAARRLIDRGAEVVAGGDTILSMALVENNVFTIPGTGAVVADPISSAIKLIELLVDIQRSFGIVRSRAGTYAGAPPDVIAAVREAFGVTLTKPTT
jgi:Asp/Glu/hydantoin racemase